MTAPDTGITELFAGENVFVTGGSGFMGKALLEKILRSCPDVNAIYVLMRPKKGKAVKDRLPDIISSPVFQPLLQENPRAFDKIRIVAGDCGELRLGLSPEDEATLTDSVSIVFHAAATVRFDDPIQSSVLLNTRGTREIVELCKRMKRLKVLQYVSTTYCHTEEPLLEEKCYSAHLDWRTVISLAEQEDPATLQAFTYKIGGTHPNTYTFSKALAEDVIREARNDIPVVIFRPAVVVSSLGEPISGWMDNLNGPFALWAVALKGVLRYTLLDGNLALSFTFVDWAIRGMLLTAWARAVNLRVSADPGDLDVVNLELSSYDRIPFSYMTPRMKELTPFAADAIRYPGVTNTTCYPYYWLGVFFSHFLYGLLMDSILQLSGRKPRLVRIYRKIFSSCEAIKYFMLNEFPIETKNILKLEKHLPISQRPAFTTELNGAGALKYSRETFSENIAIGLTKYIFKEELSIEKNKKHLRNLYAYETIRNVLLIAALFWLVGSRYLLPAFSVSISSTNI